MLLPEPIATTDDTLEMQLQPQDLTKLVVGFSVMVTGRSTPRPREHIEHMMRVVVEEVWLVGSKCVHMAVWVGIDLVRKVLVLVVLQDIAKLLLLLIAFK